MAGKNTNSISDWYKGKGLSIVLKGLCRHGCLIHYVYNDNYACLFDSPYSLWYLRNYSSMATLQVRVTRICFPSMKSNDTNNKNELCGKTVRLISFKKPRLQSVSIFFNFTIRDLLYLPYFLPRLWMFEAVMCMFDRVRWQLALFDFLQIS